MGILDPTVRGISMPVRKIINLAFQTSIALIYRHLQTRPDMSAVHAQAAILGMVLIAQVTNYPTTLHTKHIAH